MKTSALKKELTLCPVHYMTIIIIMCFRGNDIEKRKRTSSQVVHLVEL